MQLERGQLTVDNQTDEEWRSVEIWVNNYYRAMVPSIAAHGRFQVQLDSFISGYGRRFDYTARRSRDLRLSARRPNGEPLELKKEFQEAMLNEALGGTTLMARLKSELEVVCPCCQTTLVIDLNLGRVVSHHEPERGNKPELSDAHRLLAEEAARRESIFQQSVDAEKTRGDALSRRFEEALKQANQEPITKPTRDFDLD